LFHSKYKVKDKVVILSILVHYFEDFKINTKFLIL
jgi:hypothetical protein